jgi:valyl-tRNA synthetase
MDVRPQAHDIIRTWLFSTILRSELEHGSLPWKNAALSGWILDPDRKKMSKSVGNVTTPMPLLEQYGTDAVRYWAACARPGVDTAFDEGQMKIGRKLATKLLNVSKFVLGFGGATGEVTDAVDEAMLARLDVVVLDTTAAFDDYDYARALERTEAFFWWFCDDYVELVKSRAYGARGDDSAASAASALRVALSTMLRLFAPILPFVTEEVWSWWQDGSVHRAEWPTPTGSASDPDTLDTVSEVLTRVRRAKTEAKVSQRAEVAHIDVVLPPERQAAFDLALADLREAGSIASVTTRPGDAVTVAVTLA